MQPMTAEQKKQRNKGYQQKFRKEKAAKYSRLDMFIAKEDKTLFAERAKAAGKTRIQYLLYLLHDNKAQQTTFIKDDQHQIELKDLKAGYDAKEKGWADELKLSKDREDYQRSLRTDEQLRKDCAKAERKLEELTAKTEELDTENAHLSKLLEKEREINKKNKK